MLLFKSYFIFVFFFLSHVFISLIYGQPDRIFKHYTMEDGLSHNSVYSVVQDRSGFLWFATEGGLDRFDGISFVSHINDPLDTNTLPLSNANVLLSDREGNLWVGTWGGGLARYMAEKNIFIRYSNDPQNSYSLSDNRIQALYEDHLGNIWIGTYSGGLNRFDKHTGTFIRYTFNPNNPHSIPSNRIWSITEDDQRILWIGTHKGLSRISLDSLQEARFVTYRNDPVNKSSIRHDIIRTLFIDHQGSLWIGTQKGLNRKQKSRESFESYGDPKNDPAGLSSAVINCIAEDSARCLWIGTLQDGIYLLDLNHAANGFHHYVSRTGDQTGLSHNDVRSIFIDRSLNLWITTRGGGINKLDLKPKKFGLLKDFKYFSDERIWAICEQEGADSHTLWLGTDKGLIQMDRETGIVVLHQTGSAGSNSLNNNLIRALYQDGNDVLWIGTSGGGLNRYDLKTKRFTYLINKPDDPNSLSDNRIRAIYEESDVPEKPLWIGTYGGLNKYNRTTNTWERFQHVPGDSHSISHDEIRVIYKDRKGILWIGTFGGGLNRWDPEHKRFFRYQSETGRRNVLNSNDILCLAEDTDSSRHILWIGTDGQGLNRFDVASNSFSHITTSDGLPNNVIYGIIPDASGNLWISTNKGICKYHPAKNTFHNYDSHDGLQSNIFGQGAYLKGRDNILYFGGMKGVNFFNPSQVQHNPFIPPVALTAFKVFDRKDRRLLFQQRDLELSYEDYFFTFEFAALDFTIPEKNQYAFRLKGFDNDWIYSGSRRYANYTHVEPGSYIFEVKASNNDYVWNESGLAIAVTITPPYWKTWWFQSIMAIMTAVILFLIYRYRIRQIKKQKRNLENQVAERTQELIQKNEELNFLNEKKNEFMGIAAHDLRNPLNAIIGYADLMLIQIDEQLFRLETAKEDLETIQQSAKQMAHLISELLDISAIESGKVTMDLRADNLASVLKECERLHRPMAAHKNIKLYIDYSVKYPDVYIDRSRIMEVVDNLMSNAVKYTYPGGQIHVFTENYDKEVILHIKDTGQGLDEEDLKKVFMSFKRLSAKPTGGENSTGLGLAIVKKVVELHGGRVWVTSKKGEGSTFSFSLPVAN